MNERPAMTGREADVERISSIDRIPWYSQPETGERLSGIAIILILFCKQFLVVDSHRRVVVYTALGYGDDEDVNDADDHALSQMNPGCT